MISTEHQPSKGNFDGIDVAIDGKPHRHAADDLPLEADVHPKISIVVPVYNAQELLPQTLDSILSQTYLDFEVILVQDGSTDESAKVCDDYQQADRRVRVFHRQNAGPSASRNFGIDQARGEYLVFCDSDDLLTPDTLETMLSVMERFQLDLALVGFERFYPDTEKCIQYRLGPANKLLIYQSIQEFAEVYLHSRTNMFGISIWAKMYRLDIIREHNIRFPKDMNYEEDCVFNLQYFRHVTYAGAQGTVCYRYRQNASSLSKGYRKNALPSQIRGYHKRREFLTEIGMEEHVEKLDNIMLVVFFNDLVKIAESNLSDDEKIAAYQSFLDLPDVQSLFLKHSTVLQSLFKRKVCKAILAKDAKKIHQLQKIRLWKNDFVGSGKAKIARLPKPVAKTIKLIAKPFAKAIRIAKRALR